ncbi:MAG: MOSC domain-containing protein [Hyphomonadaceae bacterium]|nr:MOSC domain-containing protein [Hyphomonadaceae bacterium]
MNGKLLAIAWKEKPRAPMLTAERAIIDREAGLPGDFRGRSPDAQITIVFAEDWAQACRELGADVPWLARRANLLVAGIANPQSAGGIVRIGAATLEIMSETDPCSRMDAAHQGLRAALTPQWRGGVRTRVLEGGGIGVGDAVRLEA